MGNKNRKAVPMNSGRGIKIVVWAAYGMLRGVICGFRTANDNEGKEGQNNE